MRVSLRRRVAAVAALAAAVACAADRADPPAVRPNLLLVTIDTLRADRLGAGLTPVMDAIAARGVRFSEARTVAPLTLPAHASILTGLLPPAHGVRVNGVRAMLGGGAIAERLRRVGYRTAAVVGAFVLDRRFGLAEGFDQYDDQIVRDAKLPERLEAERPANVVIDRAIATAASMPPAQPWFLWVHLYDPHAPYAAPRKPTASISAYDAEVSFADAELGRLIAAIDQRDEWSKTAVVITGDHGEGLGEHGESTHGMLLFDSTLRVPLIVAAPGVAPAVRENPVSVVDIAPTLLALAGQPADAALPGRSLLESTDKEREIYAETEYPAAAGWQPARALIQDRFKLIASASGRLFDLSTDPAEQHNLAAARPQALAAMAARLETLSRAPVGTRPASSVPDSETAARLRALGYVATSPLRPTSPARPTSPKDAADHTAAWVTFERALSARAAGNGVAALPLLAELARQYPDGMVFVTTHAQALADGGRLGDALRVLRDLVRRWPQDAILYHELAVVARRMGQTSEAVRAERAALAIDSTLAMAHNGLGLALADAGDQRAAAEAFESAVKHDPTNASYLVNLGNVRRALGDLENARAAYQAALARDASLVDAANGLGVILVQQKRAAEAVPWLERAVTGDATFVEAQLNLAIALQESGQRERAIAQYRLVERSAPPRARERAAARALREQLEAR